MRVLAGPELAVAISAAGGLGFVGPAVKTENMENDLAEVRRLLQHRHPGLKNRSNLLSVGVGFQLWSDSLITATKLIQQYRPCIAWLYAPQNEHSDYAIWTAAFKQASPETQIWIQVGTVAETQVLLQTKQMPDVLVVQGAAAGGHGRAEDGMELMTLLPEIVDLLHEQSSPIPVLAAGGIVDGRGAAAAFCLGAQGVVMGTRFLAASEARISPGYQREIVRASDGAANTTRTLLYNHLRGTFGWPEAYAPRTIINRSFLEHREGETFERLKKFHDMAATKGDEGWGPEGRLGTYAGSSIGLIKDVKDAAQIVQDTQLEVRGVLGAGRTDDYEVRSCL